MPFNVFINGLERKVASEGAKFADSTKPYGAVKTEADCEELH